MFFRIIEIILIVFGILYIGPEKALATVTPILVSPIESQEISSATVKLIWEYSGSCSTNESCFKVEVDDSIDFSSVNKAVYTNNRSYSPQGLGIEKWYWRVKAKDTTNIWSAYSEVGSFVVKEMFTSSPIPSIALPTPNPTSDISTSKQLLEISLLPTTFNSSNQVNVKVSLKNFEKNSKFFLKGAFFKDGSTNYFGKTKVGGLWIRNNLGYSSQFPITTDEFGNFETFLEVLADTEDSGFLGSGDYLFKVGRYNVSGSGPFWSNILQTKINDDSSKKITTTITAAKISTSNTPKATAKIKVSNKLLLGESVSSSSSGIFKLPKIATVAGESSVSSEIKNSYTKNEKYINWLFVFGGGVLIIFSLGILVIVIKKR